MLEIHITAENGTRWKRGLLLLIGLALTLWLAYLAKDIWLPIIIAFMIAMVLDPLVDKMEKRGWSRLKSTALIFVVFFTVVGSVLGFAIPAVVTQTTQITNSIGQYLPSESETETKRSLNRLFHKMHASPFVKDQVLRASAQISQTVGRAGTWVGDMAKNLAANLIWIVLIPIIAFYALKDFHLILARLLLLVPRDNRTATQHTINEVSSIFVRYLRGLVVVCSLNAVATGIVLSIFHLPNAIGLGAISGLLYMVPYLGAVVTIALTGGIALMSNTVQMALIITFTLIVLHHVIFDQIITPRIVGQHVGLHPIMSIMALLIGGSLLGILGMILAVPVAATIQMIIQTLFPRLVLPIEVPTAEELHALTLEQAETNSAAPPEDQVDVHEKIVAAVDSTDDKEEQLSDSASQAISTLS